MAFGLSHMIVLTLGVLALGSVQAVEWEQCQGVQDPVVEVTKFNMEPYPAINIPGDLTLTLDTTYHEDIGDMKIKMTVWKRFAILGWIRQPCFMGMGSCTLDSSCDMAAAGMKVHEFVQSMNEQIQQMVEKNRVGAACPLTKGQLSVDKYTITLGQLPGWMPISGLYKLKVELVSKTGPERNLGCFQFEFAMHRD